MGFCCIIRTIKRVMLIAMHKKITILLFNILLSARKLIKMTVHKVNGHFYEILISPINHILIHKTICGKFRYPKIRIESSHSYIHIGSKLRRVFVSDS